MASLTATKIPKFALTATTMASLLYLLFSLIFLSSTISASPTTLTLSLHPISQNPTIDRSQTLSTLASLSIARARHLKKSKNSQNTSIFTDPLFPHSFGGYTIDLNFGTPPQKLSFIFDTGSDLVWFPCTQNYTCSNCFFPNVRNIPFFVPKASSSTKLIGCKNPKCKWIHSPEFLKAVCPGCADSENCTRICPAYGIQYKSGSTFGLLLSETLVLKNTKIENVAVGCSLIAERQPAGIAGFGRGNLSLPSQLGVRKFSFCVLSRRFDDTGRSSLLVLNGGSDSGRNLSATPFLKNPTTGNLAFRTFYYVGLRKIAVGGTHVKIPYKFLSTDSDGNGGTIVDSGSTFTFMESKIFDLVAREFENQMKHLEKAADVERLTGLRPCFNISGVKSINFPELVFHFKGGAQMALPVENYFAFAGESDVICLTVVTDGVENSGGPSIILGDFQLQNFYVAFDLEKEKFGFRRQIC